MNAGLPVEDATGLRFGTPEPLFAAGDGFWAGYDIDDEGRFLTCDCNFDGAGDRVRVVLNWTELSETAR